MATLIRKKPYTRVCIIKCIHVHSEEKRLIIFFSAKVEGEEFFDKVPGLCQLIASLCTVSCVGSLMTIGLMSINRYMYICSHDKYTRIFTKRKSICMCVSVYFVGGFLVLLNAAGIGDHGYDRKSIECIWDRMATQSYTIVFSITLVWIPSIMITTCYLRIYLHVREHSKRMRIHNQMGVSTTMRVNFHLAKTLCIIFIVFITCWAPYALILVTDTKDDYPLEAHVIITVFAHIHPSTNWIIYYYTNKRFAMAVQDLLFNNRLLRSLYLPNATKSSVSGTEGTKIKNSSIGLSENSMQVCKPHEVREVQHSERTHSSEL